MAMAVQDRVTHSDFGFVPGDSMSVGFVTGDPMSNFSLKTSE